MKFTCGIVGSGISGLYMAYRLLQKGHSVSIFEKENRIGGRLYTVKKDGYYLDLGGGRFSENHKSFIKLAHELDLDYKANQKTVTNYYKNGQEESKLDVFEKVNYVLKRSRKDFSVSELKSFTFEFLLRQYFPIEADDIIYGFGYDGPFVHSSAWYTMHQIENDFNSQFYTLVGGMSSIIKALHNRIIELGGKLHTGVTIVDYDGKNTIIDDKGMKHKFDKVCFCLPKTPLLQLIGRYSKELTNTLNSVEACQMLRIYTKEDPKLLKNKNEPRISRNTWERQTININPSDGVSMKVYCDSKWAIMWQNYIKKYGLNAYFPQAKWLLYKYWEEGVHYWKPNAKLWRNKKENNFYVVGEAVADYHRCWSEGALQSAEKLLKII